MHDPEFRLARIASELTIIRWAIWVILALVGFIAVIVPMPEGRGL